MPEIDEILYPYLMSTLTTSTNFKACFNRSLLHEMNILDVYPESRNIRPIQSVPYSSRTMAFDFEKLAVYNMLEMKAFKSARTE